jgi:hypothetical protein
MKGCKPYCLKVFLNVPMKKILTSILLEIFIAVHFPCVKILVGQSVNLDWAVNIGGDLGESSFALAIDQNDNVITAGSFWGTSDFDPGPGFFNLTAEDYADAYICKLDNSGNFQWAVQFAGLQWSECSSLAIDNSGNIYSTGFFWDSADFDPGQGQYYLSSEGGADIFISKLDHSGNFIWAKRIGGSSIDDYGLNLTVDDSSNVLTTGVFWGTVDFDPGIDTFYMTAGGGRGAFISKLDNNGNFVWAKHIGGIAWDEGLSITVDNTGNVYTTGVFQANADLDPGMDTFNVVSAGAHDIFITKLDAAGNFIWAKQFSGTGIDYGLATVLDQTGNIYTTGYFYDTNDFDPGPEIYNLISFGSKDVFVSKLDNSGNFVWARQFGGISSSQGRSIAVDDIGNIYTTGYFWDSADFDPGPDTLNLISAGYSDNFIVKLDDAGNLVWVQQFGGPSNEFCFSVLTDPLMNIYTSGTFGENVDFDPGSATFVLYPAGGSDVYIQKLNQTSVDLQQIISHSQINIYPNPFQGDFIIELGELYNYAEITLLDIFGKIIAKDKYTQISTIYYSPDIQSGLYFIQIITETGMKTVVKLVKT